VDPDRLVERLYLGHRARIHSLARRMIGMRETEDVNEITQEIFVRAWQKLGTFRGESAFGSWLYRLAINLILGRRAAFALSRSRLQEGEAALERAASRPAPLDFTLDFDAAIQRVPDGARQVFVLHDVEGHKHREIASLLGISTGTSKAQLHRARMLLRRHLAAGSGLAP
jgi:RNA polymerase sigma-70 factor (ECF subfamily)